MLKYWNAETTGFQAAEKYLIILCSSLKYLVLLMTLPFVMVLNPWNVSRRCCLCTAPHTVGVLVHSRSSWAWHKCKQCIRIHKYCINNECQENREREECDSTPPSPLFLHLFPSHMTDRFLHWIANTFPFPRTAKPREKWQKDIYNTSALGNHCCSSGVIWCLASTVFTAHKVSYAKMEYADFVTFAVSLSNLLRHLEEKARFSEYQ